MGTVARILQALGVDPATVIEAAPCLGATGAAFLASTGQNIANGFSPGAEALDVLGTLPRVQVAGAGVAGLLGEGSGQTAANILSGIVGGSAIVSEPAIAGAERSCE